MPKPKGILFDLDGTLVDSLGLTFDSFHRALDSVGERPRTREEIAAHFGAGEDVILSKLLGAERGRETYEAYCAHFSSNIASAPLFPGVLEALDGLAGRGARLAICTGRSTRTTERILAHHGLAPRFMTIVTDDRVPHPKPHPAGVFLAAKEMGIDPGEILFVGDSPSDLAAATAAKALPIAAAWYPRVSRERLLEAEPAAWLEHPQELLTLWEKLLI